MQLRQRHQQPKVKWRVKGVGCLRKGQIGRRIIGTIIEPYIVDGVTRKREFTFHATKGFRSTRIV